MQLGGKPLEAAKKYKVAGWAPVSEEAQAAGGEPVWDVVARYLRAKKTIKPRTLNLPEVVGVAGNPGMGSGRIWGNVRGGPAFQTPARPRPASDGQFAAFCGSATGCDIGRLADGRSYQCPRQSRTIRPTRSDCGR